jgi:hypothetical protein
LKDVSPEPVLPSEVPSLVEGLEGVDPVLGSVDGLVG